MQFNRLGDVTGDGFPDLVTRYNDLPSQGTSGVLLFVGAGDGTDGVVTNDYQSIIGVGVERTVSAWILDGATPFSAPPQLLPTNIGEFVAIDRDGDGDDEVVLARAPFQSFSDDLFLIDWDAAANPTLVGSIEVTTASGSATALGAGDIDGDGDQDLVFTTFGGDDVYVLENVGGMLVAGPLQINIGGSPYISRSFMVDWDGDGDDDMAYFDFSSQFDTAYLYLAESEGLLVDLASYWSWPGTSGAYGIADVVDLNEGEGTVAIDKTFWTTAIPGFVIPHQALLVHAGYPAGFALTNAVTIGYGF